MKKISLLLLSLILLMSSVYALTSIEKGTNWLVNNTNWNEDIESAVFSSLVLDSTEYSLEAQQGLTSLQQRKDSEDCWPKNNCKIKETALALLAFNNFNQPTKDILDWLYSNQIPALETENFWIQVATNADGQCSIGYDGNQKSFTIQDNKVLQCQNKPWINLNCIEQNFLASSLAREVEVDCTPLQGDVIISLIYKTDDTYYILQEEHSHIADIKINNACFGLSDTSTTCNYESTIFATWVLSTINEDLTTLSYLESEIQPTNILGYSLLSLITKKSVYLNWLEENQGAAGNFGDIYTTAFANLALKDRPSSESSTDWLKLMQELDGSWNNNMKNTAVVLYSLLGGIEPTPIPTEETCINLGYECCDSCEQGYEQSFYDDTCSPTEVCCERCGAIIRESFCGDDICDTNEDCDCIDCIDEPACIEYAEEICNNRIDDDKDGYTDCDDNDCFDESACKILVVNNEICNNRIDDDKDGYTDCDDNDCFDAENCKEKKFPMWIIIILVIIVSLIILLFVYQKFLKDKLPALFEKGKSYKKPPSEIPPQRPAYPARQPPVIQRQRPPIKSRIEEELEKSLEEAKKLLKGKKKK